MAKIEFLSAQTIRAVGAPAAGGAKIGTPVPRGETSLLHCAIARHHAVALALRENQNRGRGQREARSEQFVKLDKGGMRSRCGSTERSTKIRRRRVRLETASRGEYLWDCNSRVDGRATMRISRPKDHHWSGSRRTFTGCRRHHIRENRVDGLSSKRARMHAKRSLSILGAFWHRPNI